VVGPVEVHDKDAHLPFHDLADKRHSALLGWAVRQQREYVAA
jgi:hypothetical protein